MMYNLKLITEIRGPDNEGPSRQGLLLPCPLLFEFYLISSARKPVLPGVRLDICRKIKYIFLMRQRKP